MQTLRRVVVFGTIVLASAAGLRGGLAWGPHGRITKAAREVLPDMDRWKQALGAQNVAALDRYCLLPDQRGKDLGAFYADEHRVGVSVHVQTNKPLAQSIERVWVVPEETPARGSPHP